MVEQSFVRDVGGVRVRLPQPQHLMLMKAFAGRLVDLLDLERLIKTYPEFDHEWLRRSLAELAELVDRPELSSQLDVVLRSQDR